MRHNVAQAIAEVRRMFEARKRYGHAVGDPGPAWEHARTLADEVERLHKRIKFLEDEQDRKLPPARG